MTLIEKVPNRKEVQSPCIKLIKNCLIDSSQRTRFYRLCYAKKQFAIMFYFALNFHESLPVSWPCSFLCGKFSGCKSLAINAGSVSDWISQKYA